LETVLAMAAVEPAFAQALGKRCDEALAASGVVVSEQERRILRATPSESLRLMSLNLEQRIPAANRRSFLRRAGQSLAILAGTTLVARDAEAQPSEHAQVWWEDSGPRVGLRGGTGTGSRPDPGRHRNSKVLLSAVKTAGPLSRGVVRRVMRRHLVRILHYYRQELVMRPKLKGTLRVKFVITAAGTVRFVKLVGSDLRAPGLERNVLRTIKSWRFPVPGRIASTTVTAKYRFRPGK